LHNFSGICGLGAACLEALGAVVLVVLGWNAAIVNLVRFLVKMVWEEALRSLCAWLVVWLVV